MTKKTNKLEQVLRFLLAQTWVLNGTVCKQQETTSVTQLDGQADLETSAESLDSQLMTLLGHDLKT